MERKRSGFSMLEVLAVTAISMIITMITIPNMITAINNMRLRSSMTSLAGVLQNCRMLAVKQNQIMTTHFAISTYGAGNGVIAYVKAASDPNPISTTDSQVQLEQPVTQVPDLTAPDAPSTAPTLGFTAATSEPSFTTTGLPCTHSVTGCTNSGFVYYFHDTRTSSRTGWAAISISPAGRLKKWYWNGTTWTG
jgi:Tfp pilus assembly protein FimT